MFRTNVLWNSGADSGRADRFSGEALSALPESARLALCLGSNVIQIGCNDGACLLAVDDRHNFYRGAKAAPLQDPLLKEAQIVTFHQLKAAAEIGFNPTVDVF